MQTVSLSMISFIFSAGKLWHSNMIHVYLGIHTLAQIKPGDKGYVATSVETFPSMLDGKR